MDLPRCDDPRTLRAISALHRESNDFGRFVNYLEECEKKLTKDNIIEKDDVLMRQNQGALQLIHRIYRLMDDSYNMWKKVTTK